MRNLTKSEKLAVKEEFDFQIGGILNLIDDAGLEAANIKTIEDAKNIVDNVAHILLKEMRNRNTEICFTSTELNKFINKLKIAATTELEDAIKYELAH